MIGSYLAVKYGGLGAAIDRWLLDRNQFTVEEEDFIVQYIVTGGSNYNG